MISTMKTLLVTTITVAVLHGAASAEDAPAKVKIKAWKADPVELYDGPDGKVVNFRHRLDSHGQYLAFQP